MNFWLSYILIAILGTVGVYYGTQPLWQALGHPLSSPAPAMATTGVRTSDPTLAPKGSVIRPATSIARPTPTPSPDVGPAATPAPSADNTTRPGDAAAPATTTESKPPDATTPGNSPYPAPAPGCTAWGLTLASASYYSLSGENRGKLPGGTIMDIDEGRNSSKGDMSLGRVERNNAMLGPYLVANADLVRFNVPRSEVPVENIATLKQYYFLKGTLDQRLTDLKQQAVGANPFAAAYGEAVQKYNEFGTREKQLVTKRDAASGAERMRLMDQLREMIPENQRLLRAVNESKEKYNKWKAANPAAATPDLASDPQALELKKQLAALEPQVKEIVK